MAPALTLAPNNDILQPFYRKLLPRMGINRNVLQVLTAVPFYIRRFQLKGLDIEQAIESISILIACFNSPL